MPATTTRLACLLAASGIFAATVPAQQPDTWAFRPGVDRFSAKALLDLRSLNEQVAGQSGFVRRSADGNDLVLGDGSPARFWCVNTYVQKPPHGRQPKRDLASHARFLAKRGVNMVRFHGSCQPRQEGSKITDFDRAARDQCWRLVAEMKKQGIYTTISPYYALTVKIRKSWGVDGGPQNAHGLLFFDETLQRGYKAWLKALFDEKNPHTGLRLADDPAVAIIQLQNEDSLLFWTSGKIKGPQAVKLARTFGTWLVRKYGSLDKARKAWGGVSVKADDFDNGVVAMLHVWEMTQDRKGGRARRLDDQLQFWTELMRDFNAEMIRYLREEIGCKQLVNPGNWRTADNARLLDAERYSYTAGEVIAMNRYYSATHTGKWQGWAIVKGDKFVDRSVLTHPLELPLAIRQVAGHPMIIPESNWVPPNGLQAEGPFLVAAYQSLLGIDGFYWFATSDTQWRPPSSANGYADSIGKWVIATPPVMGGFPAAALLYRKGYVRQAEPAVTEVRSLESIWKRAEPALLEGAGFDPNRDPGDRTAGRAGGKLHPLHFLIGPVVTDFREPRAEARQGQDDPRARKPGIHVDQEQIGPDSSRRVGPTAAEIRARTVTSRTGQLRWDYGKGLCVLNAPKAQGACGFLRRAGAIRTDAVGIDCQNEYAAVLVVAMDDKPLKTSGRILVQVTTRARPTGWQTRPTRIQRKNAPALDGQEIVSHGQAPWRVERAQVKLQLQNLVVDQAATLDANGMPVGRARLGRTGTSVQLVFPAEAMYVVLTDQAGR